MKSYIDFIKSDEIKNNMFVFTGGPLTDKVINATYDFNQVDRKVQGIIIFTSETYKEMNMQYLGRFNGLVLDVVIHFPQLLERFNKAVKDIEMNSKLVAINANLQSYF